MARRLFAGLLVTALVGAGLLAWLGSGDEAAAPRAPPRSGDGGVRSVREHVRLPQNGAEVDTELETATGTAALTVRVLGDTGDAIAGATVEVRRAAESRAAHTDERDSRDSAGRRPGLRLWQSPHPGSPMPTVSTSGRSRTPRSIGPCCSPVRTPRVSAPPPSRASRCRASRSTRSSTTTRGGDPRSPTRKGAARCAGCRRGP